MGIDRKRSVEGRAKSLVEQDLENWYKQTMPKLYRFIYYKLQNHEETEDITQETYARCLRSSQDKTNLPPYPYLKEAAQNLIYDRFRRLKVHSFVLFDQELTDEKLPEEVVTTQNFVQELLNMLPVEYQMVLQLRIVEGYSRKETAQRMGRSEDAVRGLQYRAIQTLRDLMHKTKED